MSDVTRPPGDDTPGARGHNAPDARGESALGTGHGTAPATDRGDAHGAGAVGGTGTREGAGIGAAPVPGTGARGGSGGGAAPGTQQGGAFGAHLLPHDESDKLTSQLQHAVAGFVDGPRAAVEEADHVLEEITARFTDAVTQRRRTLRRSWQSVEGGEGKPASTADTEQLRLALKDYRELAERLLHV